MRISQSLFFPLIATALICSAALAQGQAPAARITSEIDNANRSTIPGTLHPWVQSRAALGEVPSSTVLRGVTVVFKRSAAQESELQTLLAAQQNPSSSLYHKWLTPDEFATRFGLADADISKVKSWLSQEGFTVTRVSRDKGRILFSGTAAQVETAFGAKLMYYEVGGEKVYAPAGELSVPSALSSVVMTVANLSSIRPKPHVVQSSQMSDVNPNFTSVTSGGHFLTPGDVSTIYDINDAYTAGYTGANQSIAIVGQSAVVVSDIENFQSAAGLTVKDPTLVLVPSTGTSTIYSGDEMESDLDLEYSGGIAKDATIYFVYTGNNSSYNVFDSIVYAIETDIAPVISISYGTCETSLSTTAYTYYNGYFEQGAAQGQTLVAASGDSGSTDCYAYTTLSTSAQDALAVDFPASSQYVTGMGGTEFSSTNSTSSTYWDSATTSTGDIISSAISYIPEQVWNDGSSSSSLSAGGGGISTITVRPSWQTGVSGITSGSYRLVPDVSLASSAEYTGYLFCSSDSSITTVTGSCSNGFRDSSSSGRLTVAGGTSFAAPIFAGMVAIINQQQNSTGQGTLNSTLYKMAANSTAYAAAFHDITSGNNCADSSLCSTSYAATTGYDKATGLGSVDLNYLLNYWSTYSSSATSLAASTTSISAASSTPDSGASDTITITVASGSTAYTATPTGTLKILVDGTTANSALALNSGQATYSFSSTTSGSHVIVATYSGDTIYAPSTSSIVVTVSGSGTFTLSATNVTASQGSSGTSTVTITSQNSYAGTVGFTLATSSTSLQTYGCYYVSDKAVTANGTATTTLTLYTSASVCNTTAAVKSGVRHNFVLAGTKPIASSQPSSPLRKALPIGAVALAGCFLLGIRKRRVKWFSALGCFILLGLVSLAVGCGGSSSVTTSNYVAKGTYTATLTGTDTTDSNITDTTTLTLVVD